jgi:hypothetical protein
LAKGTASSLTTRVETRVRVGMSMPLPHCRTVRAGGRRHSNKMDPCATVCDVADTRNRQQARKV